MLWVNGHAGFGKTIICARLVKHLLVTDDGPVAHFFYSPGFSRRDDPYVVVRSWLTQLMSGYPAITDLVHERRDERQVADRSMVISLLREILGLVPNCTLVVDGLDECLALQESHLSITNFVRDVMDSLANTTRLLIVSRDEPEIREALAMKQLCEIKICPEDVERDTAILSWDIISRKLPTKSEDVRKNLSQRMAHRCDGQFLWLTMQEASLRKGMTRNQLQLAIEETPTGLERLYERYWKRILDRRPWDRDRAFSILRWVAFSRRPLTAGEIVEAVLIDEESDEFPVDDVPDDIEDYIESEILGLCSPLVEIRNQASENAKRAPISIAQLAHFSVKQYLTSRLPTKSIAANEALRSTYEEAQNALLAQMCLRYIRSLCWDRPSLSVATTFRAIFFEYAASSWYIHLKSASGFQADSNIVNIALDFMDEHHPAWYLWRAWFDENHEESEYKENVALETQPPEPLYYALEVGLTSISTRIIQGANTGECWIRSETRPALLHACRKGHVAIVEAMLDMGANIETRDHIGRSPLYTAAMEGQQKVVEILIKRGANTSSANYHGSTTLMMAAFHGHADAVEVLIKHGASVSSVNDRGTTALILAAYSGHTDVVKVLVNYGADVSSTNHKGTNALMVASGSGHLGLVKLLLSHGADINAVNEVRCTAVLAAAISSHKALTSMLIERGATVHGALEYNSGRALIHLVVASNDTKSLRLVIREGASVTVTDKQRQTPLHIAAEFGHFQSAQLLLEHASDPNARDRLDWTPLHFAVRRKDTRICRLLLQNGADANSVTDRGATALHLAAMFDHPGIVTSLLASSQISINARENHGNTALSIASTFGNLDVVQTLLADDRINTENRDYYGNTALIAAVRNGHKEVVGLLLEAASDITIANLCGGLDHPLMWWGQRGVDPGVVTVLQEYTTRFGTTSKDLRFPKYSIRVTSGSNRAFCDVCILRIPDTDHRYHCWVCNRGDFDICVECYRLGFWCHEPSHILKRCFLSNELTLETVGGGKAES